MVTLRTKQLEGNRERLYLDYYPAIPHPVTGKLTRREFLDLFIYSENEFELKIFTDKTGKEKKKYIPVLNRKGNSPYAKTTPRGTSVVNNFCIS